MYSNLLENQQKKIIYIIFKNGESVVMTQEDRSKPVCVPSVLDH